MHTTERHRDKRPFQPSITSFFARDDFDSDDDEPRGPHPTSRPRTKHHSAATQQRESLAPQLPGHVQSDLLQVGMRVRKSVPEGYKTQNKMSTRPSIQTTLSKPPTTTITAVGVELKAPRGPVPDDFVHQRELLPFCGLHKIGGFAEQPTTNIHLYAGIDSSGHRPTNLFPLPAEAFSQPFSSQGSTDSGYGSDMLRSNPSKRSWRDEDDIRLDVSGSNFFFALPMKGGVELDEVPVSPLSETPGQGINMLPAVRQFAQPKSRRAATRLTMNGDEDIDMDTENAALDSRIVLGSGSDFEEADFLAAGEIAMGGV